MSLPKRHLLIAAIFWFTVALSAGAAMSSCEELDVAKPAAIYLSLSAADLGTTEWAVRHGYVESNPWMQSHRIEKQLAVTGAFLAADFYLQKKERRTGVRVLRVTYAVARIGAVALSVRNMRRGQ